jgi:hypothetical protein
MNYKLEKYHKDLEAISYVEKARAKKVDYMNNVALTLMLIEQGIAYCLNGKKMHSAPIREDSEIPDGLYQFLSVKKNEIIITPYEQTDKENPLKFPNVQMFIPKIEDMTCLGEVGENPSKAMALFSQQTIEAYINYDVIEGSPIKSMQIYIIKGKPLSPILLKDTESNFQAIIMPCKMNP